LFRLTSTLTKGYFKNLLPPFFPLTLSFSPLSFIAHPGLFKRFQEEASPAREVTDAYYFSKDIVESFATLKGSFGAQHSNLQLLFQTD
jgi:hypothetical protein